jgi:hypothetical protein
LGPRVKPEDDEMGRMGVGFWRLYMSLAQPPLIRPGFAGPPSPSRGEGEKGRWGECCGKEAFPPHRLNPLNSLYPSPRHCRA